MQPRQITIFSPQDDKKSIVDLLTEFDDFGRETNIFVSEGIRYFVNEYWTSRQRQSHNLHEVSYRACFKAELPRFFIERMTNQGERVYDPFMGRGTTLLEAALLGRVAAGNDINPLSRMLVQPRLTPPKLDQISRRLGEINLEKAKAKKHSDLFAFYHPETLAEIEALRSWLIEREALGKLDPVDMWIRMVAINRLTGHSTGFFSVYSLPPNQAVSIDSQRKINEKRGQVPPRRYVADIILKKSRNLLAEGAPNPAIHGPLMTGRASATPALAEGSVDLLVTSPPFLDIVNYKQDNWLRCWFAGIDPDTIAIDHHRTVTEWERFVRESFVEFVRVMRPGGHIAFEVGEVRGGKVLLERHVVNATKGLPLQLLGVMVNDQEFTKTANCWGVSNNTGGTNTNRIVLFRKEI